MLADLVGERCWRALSSRRSLFFSFTLFWLGRFVSLGCGGIGSEKICFKRRGLWDFVRWEKREVAGRVRACLNNQSLLMRWFILLNYVWTDWDERLHRSRPSYVSYFCHISMTSETRAQVVASYSFVLLLYLCLPKTRYKCILLLCIRALPTLWSVSNLLAITNPHLYNFRNNLTTTSTNDIQLYHERMISFHRTVGLDRQLFGKFVTCFFWRHAVQIKSGYSRLGWFLDGSLVRCCISCTYSSEGRDAL